MFKYISSFLLFLILFSVGYSCEKGGKVLLKKVLNNQVTIIYKKTKGEGIIAGSVFFKGGSIEDPEGKKGLTNLTLKLLLKGTKNYDFISLNKLFEDSGRQIKARKNKRNFTDKSQKRGRFFLRLWPVEKNNL